MSVPISPFRDVQNFEHRWGKKFGFQSGYVPSAKEAQDMQKHAWQTSVNRGIQNALAPRKPEGQMEQPEPAIAQQPEEQMISPLQQRDEMKRKRLHSMGLL